MIEVRPFDSLGKADHGWLKANFHFSFAGYFDQRRMHWGKLRVWNDDIIAGKSGFPPHPHEDMEIITYVRKGAISHKDSLGNEGTTVAGDVQVMSAGTGIVHAEYNLAEEELQSFQLWIMSDRKGLPPSWGTKPFPKEAREGQFAVLASGREEAMDEDALRISADARVLGATVKAGESVRYDLGGRKGYLVPASGKIEIAGERANARDGVAIADLDVLEVTALEDAELVLVDSA
ncbi:pirin family protein [Alteraurantiacibacter aquimixticola]|uniref:Pirin family protein n=1 Tax=Alteraurantiacibacter aquimixticola TaxID=2489173 RepID=A0A4V4U8N3_9SPHN|nr:pirin family protein [Alteraurantiacibacter aquimixticola]TIX50663.1 pirin family protein [Alteraurantiacibacter aquimixticola]